jgi:hypothetical protein
MDNDELLAAIQDKIRIAVMEGMGAHIQEKHAPFEAKLDTVVTEMKTHIGALEKQVAFWRGALFVFGLLFTAALAVIERGGH